MKMLWTMTALLPMAVLAKEVQLDIAVTDDEGRPAAGVNVECYAKVRPLLPFAKVESRRTACQTGADGKAVVTLDVWDGFVNCYLHGEGYYPERRQDVRFESHFDREAGDTVVTGSRMAVSVRMRRKKNPVKMVGHYVSKCTQLFPKNGERFEYDLQRADWVAPHGKGEVADLVVTRKWHEDADRIDCTGTIEFVGKGAGAYVSKLFPCKEFEVDYQADTNREFRTSFPFSYHEDRRTRDCKVDMILGEDEYLVARTRVRTDVKGRILEAHYSSILGKVFFARYFSLGTWFFNPRVNDVNLEYLREESLAH